MGMHEVSEAAKIITASADPNAKVIFGAILNESMKDEIKVTVIATGFEDVKENKAPVSTVIAAGSFSPSSFVKAKAAPSAPVAEPKARPPQFEVEKPAQPVVKQRPKPEDNEDLEIPAFIRKKMLN